ncbi:MAG: hypothetical protein M1838_005588 [Thelocarpon superellum]|nr:MAG: hypothetical protein M1838_005588 [Thelocarpon superellum]
MAEYLEAGLGWLLSSLRARDDKLFIKGEAFADHPEPTLIVNSPECGASNSALSLRHAQLGPSQFPHLAWHTDAATPSIKEYLLIVEDPDAPLPTPVTHGLYYAIPASVTHVTNEDFQLVSEESGDHSLYGGFKFGQNRRGTVYSGPRPVMGHGPHRYWFEVIGLKEPVDLAALSPKATKEELAREITGKVRGWGVWIGMYERKRGETPTEGASSTST